MMNTIFRKEVTQGWLSVYMDDLAIHTKPKPGELEQQHLNWHRQHTHHILDKLEENDLYLKPEKCEFEKEWIPRIYRLLPLLCSELLQNRPTITRPNQMNSGLALGREPTQCI
jgi:hypothetical protein